MHVERLIIDSGDRTLTATFDPGFTVVEGLGSAARRALINELVQSFRGARAGVHLELYCDRRHLTVFRPRSGRHRVVDTDAVDDVTERYIGSEGTIDLFQALGVDPALASNAIHFTSEDLRLRAESDAWIAALAAAPQDRLWNAAMRLNSARSLVSQASAETGTTPEDAELLIRIEEQHAELVAATKTYERVRLLALTLGTVAVIGGAASTMADMTLLAVPLLAVALSGLILGFRYRLGRNRAKAAEQNLLNEAGADDYASFHLERVGSLLETDIERRRYMSAISDLHRAQQEWAGVAGDIPVQFAIDHEPQVQEAFRHGAIVHERRSSAAGAAADDTTEIVQAVLARLEAVRALTSGETLPLVLDDPFDGLDRTTKHALLELLLRSSTIQQMIVMSEDSDVLDWARAITAQGGHVLLTAPTIAASGDLVV